MTNERFCEREDGFMKILHIAPNAPYNDYWGYQENLLPKYHKKMGHDVTVIVPNLTHEGGKIVATECADYVLNDGVRVIRLRRKEYVHRVLTSVKARLPVMPYLKEIRPDFVFFHGLVSDSIYDVVKYKKQINPACTIVRDNHLDYYNNNRSENWKQRIIRGYHRYVNQRTINYVAKVYGVTPWRKTYAEDYFRIPAKKTDVLIVGADDERVDFANAETIRARIRNDNDIADTDFLVVTGGKIDKEKNICQLMQAVKDVPNVKLLIFGQIKEDVELEFNALLKDNGNIIYIGWLDADRVYDYFFAADLVVFPGSHSVIWEQACACKVPCVFKRWEGMEHVNTCGNSDFISQISEKTLKEKILMLLFTEKYYEMKCAAESAAMDVYLYSNIAKKSLECTKVE